MWFHQMKTGDRYLFRFGAKAQRRHRPDGLNTASLVLRIGELDGEHCCYILPRTLGTSTRLGPTPLVKQSLLPLASQRISVAYAYTRALSPEFQLKHETSVIESKLRLLFTSCRGRMCSARCRPHSSQAHFDQAKHLKLDCKTRYVSIYYFILYYFIPCHMKQRP